METGTEIILQRMKDCPEEFMGDNMGISRWERIIGDARDYLPKDDIEALDAGYKQVRIDLYNERVLKKLAGEDDEIFKGRLVEKQYYGGAIASQGTLQDHAAQHQQMMQERREMQIQQEVRDRAAQNSSAYPTAGLQNSILGGLWK
jgi:hypothetical protein